MSSRRTRLRRTLRSAVGAAGAAVFVAATAAASAAVTVHPVSHPPTHSADSKPHTAVAREEAKHTAKPVASRSSAATKKDKAFAVGGKSVAGRRSAAVAKPIGKNAARGRRVEVEEDAPVTKGRAKAGRGVGTGAKGSKGTKAGTAASAKTAGKAPAKSKHKHQPADDADNDPPVVYRASTKQKSASSAPRDVATRATSTHVDREEETPATETGSAFADGGMKGHHERRPGPAAMATRHGATTTSAPAEGSGTALNRNNDTPRTQATNEDFLRAAGIARADTPVAAEKPEEHARGESHPDDDVRVNMHTDVHVPAPAIVRRSSSAQTKSPVPAVVTAVPASYASAPLPAVTDKVRTKKTAKVDILPEDLAGKNAVIEEAMTPMVLPNLYSGGRLVVPPPMKGSHDILVHQNTMADADGLSRIQDDEDLNRMRAAHLLVPVVESDALEVNSELPMNRRYARPWTARFVQDTARAYYARFHDPLRLSSAVRTVAYQLRLQRVNGNAAAVDGEGASPHLTGQAIDFGKHGMTVAEIAWMRAYLGPIMDAGKIDVEEEFQQACFHISVYKAYVPAPAKKPRVMEVAQVHQAPIVRRAPKADKADVDGPDASPENDSQQ